MRKEKEAPQKMSKRRRNIAGIITVTAALAAGVAAQPAAADLPFDPSTLVTLTSNQANHPTGLNYTLVIPQTSGADELATADLKKAIVQLPRGMTVDPGAGANLGSCTSAEFGVHTSGATQCPTNSILGDVTVTTPLLTRSLSGHIFLARQFDNPFNTLFAIYLEVIDEQDGIEIKLPGRIDLDPNFGILTTTFDDNPQLPFDHLFIQLHTLGGGPLVTPPCGSYGLKTTLFSWAQPDVAVPLSSPFTISTGCAATRSQGLALSNSTGLPTALNVNRIMGKNSKKKKHHRSRG